MPGTVITQQDLLKFREKCTKYGHENHIAKLNLLKQYSSCRLRTATKILKYQDSLLFLSAYPDSKIIYDKANDEINRINKLSELLLKKANQKRQIAFASSGLASSYFIGSFSHAMCKWLLQNFPSHISFHSFGESYYLKQEILGMTLLPSESSLLESYGLAENRWIKLASGTKKGSDYLAWLLNSMDRDDISPMHSDFLFDSLQMYISVDVNKINAQALLRAPCGKTHIHHDGLIKNFDTSHILNRKLSKALKLNKAQQKEYIRVARFALLHLSRETDPVSYCNENGVEVHNLERGFSIALFYLLPERRNPVDAYIGYMIFKNRIPCGYGGAWIFGNKAKIGLNIFPAFRGGESGFLFSQILRTYKQRFNIRYFEAEPYQIGFENPEGIKSGAFWFYYKFGFRPMQPELYEIAKVEYGKLKDDPKHRTPFDTLKTLANSMMFLDTFKPQEKTKKHLPDSINISKVISGIITSNFGGDRMVALNFFKKELKRKCGISQSVLRGENEKLSFNVLAPLLYLLVTDPAYNKKDKAAFLQLIRSKAECTEYNYLKHVRKFQSRLQKIILRIN